MITLINAVVLNVGSMSEAPGELLKIAGPKVYLIPIKSILWAGIHA